MHAFLLPQQAADWLHQLGVTALRCDSRQVQPGEAFVAWPGYATDGRAWVPSALQAGARACVVEAAALPPALATLPDGSVLGSLSDLKAQAGLMAAAFYRFPSHALDVVAVTGTNGKTSTTWWLAQALAACGRRCGVVGTLGVGEPGTAQAPLAAMRYTGLTTPDPVAVQHALREWVDHGFQSVAMEASSIGVAEHRLAGTRVAVAVFTNFTQDHLDYHGSMANYWQAKRRLFDWPDLRAAVVHVDDLQGQRLADELLAQGRVDVWTTSLHQAQARLRVVHQRATPQGLLLTVVEDGVEWDVPHAVVGDYNAANLLGVLATLRALGVPLAQAVQACTVLVPVPGRLQRVDGGDADGAAHEPLVLVDYAHTPDALHQVLRALRPLATARGGRLHCVVGCGGDRDQGKRPLMAAEAETGADGVWLTSDNPRTEQPQTILGHMVAGLRHPERAQVLPDRAEAIARAVQAASPADVVLIAGKGHETTQDVGGRLLPFSDAEHARLALGLRVRSCGVFA